MLLAHAGTLEYPVFTHYTDYAELIRKAPLLAERAPLCRGMPNRDLYASIQALLAGTTPVGFTALPPAHAQIKAGALRALALTGTERWHDLPDVPTMLELGYPGFVSETFQGFLAPAGTPPEIVARLAAEGLAVVSAVG
jgi:hypothetical protein